MRTRRKFHKKNRLTALTEINVTPLIDLAFALLIIFMIATPLLEQTIPINLPGEVSKPQLDVKNDIQVVSISRQGELYWGSKKVTEAEMTVLLQETSKADVVPVLRIRADKELPYESVIGLIDLIKQNNLVKISLDTEVK
ncbi:MAG: Biopolymer transport protein ExbD [Puniceicoccaceae bacterium MED-G32]|nr:MAG: Biopolymer transport protein ExbD [Puniceicoccaceae bacterium MED-G32]